jgi:hypothetical protein
MAMMPTTASNSTSEKARARRGRAGVKGFRGSGVKLEFEIRRPVVGGRTKEGLKIPFHLILPPKPK